MSTTTDPAEHARAIAAELGLAPATASACSPRPGSLDVAVRRGRRRRATPPSGSRRRRGRPRRTATWSRWDAGHDQLVCWVPAPLCRRRPGRTRWPPPPRPRPRRCSRPACPARARRRTHRRCAARPAATEPYGGPRSVWGARLARARRTARSRRRRRGSRAGRVITLVLGGARSGKSAVAERLAVAPAAAGHLRRHRSSTRTTPTMAARVGRPPARRAARGRRSRPARPRRGARGRRRAPCSSTRSAPGWRRTPTSPSTSTACAPRSRPRPGDTVVVSRRGRPRRAPDTESGRRFRDALGDGQPARGRRRRRGAARGRRPGAARWSAAMRRGPRLPHPAGRRGARPIAAHAAVVPAGRAPLIGAGGRGGVVGGRPSCGRRGRRPRSSSPPTSRSPGCSTSTGWPTAPTACCRTSPASAGSRSWPSPTSARSAWRRRGVVLLLRVRRARVDGAATCCSSPALWCASRDGHGGGGPAPCRTPGRRRAGHRRSSAATGAAVAALGVLGALVLGARGRRRR